MARHHPPGNFSRCSPRSLYILHVTQRDKLRKGLNSPAGVSAISLDWAAREASSEICTVLKSAAGRH